MCYSGNCRYENYLGDCTVQRYPPTDGLCAINEFQTQYDKKKDDIKYLVALGNYGDEALSLLQNDYDLKHLAPEVALFIKIVQLLWEREGILL
jgi:hypothetical protein